MTVTCIPCTCIHCMVRWILIAGLFVPGRWLVGHGKPSHVGQETRQQQKERAPIDGETRQERIGGQRKASAAVASPEISGFHEETRRGRRIPELRHGGIPIHQQTGEHIPQLPQREERPEEPIPPRPPLRPQPGDTGRQTRRRLHPRLIWSVLSFLPGLFPIII